MVAAVGGHLAFTATILHLVTNIHYNCSCGDKKIPVHRPRVEFLLYYSRQLVLHVTLEVCGIDIRILQCLTLIWIRTWIQIPVLCRIFPLVQIYSDPPIKMYVTGVESCRWDRDLSIKWVQYPFGKGIQI